MSYLTRSGAVAAAQRKGWKSFMTYFDRSTRVWHFKEVAMENPAQSWEALDFVHHVEWGLYDGGKLKPCIVVTCRREEITETVPDAWVLEPIARELWYDDNDHAARAQA